MNKPGTNLMERVDTSLKGIAERLPKETVQELRNMAREDLANGTPVEIIIDDIYDEIVIAMNGYDPIPNLEEAKKRPTAWLILGGDYGGQIYMTIPAQHIHCDESTIQELLIFIDEIDWVGNEGGGNFQKFKHYISGMGVSGGMGGGVVLDELWVHDTFKFMKQKINDVLAGKALVSSLEPVIIPTPSLLKYAEEGERLKSKGFSAILFWHF